LLRSEKDRRVTILVMQKLARTLRAARKPRKLTNDMPIIPISD
jgi:hypothetical protein